VSIYTVVRKAKGVLFRESYTVLSRATAQEFGPAYRACRRCPDRTGCGQHLSVRADRPPARRRFEGSGVAVYRTEQPSRRVVGDDRFSAATFGKHESRP